MQNFSIKRGRRRFAAYIIAAVLILSLTGIKAVAIIDAAAFSDVCGLAGILFTAYFSSVIGGKIAAAMQQRPRKNSGGASELAPLD